MQTLNNTSKRGIADKKEKSKSISRIRIAIWAIVAFQVILTVSFLLALYRNQKLVNVEQKYSQSKCPEYTCCQL